MHTEKLWSKNYILSMLSALFSSMVMNMTVTTLTLYAINTYHIGTSAGGFLAGIMLVGGAFGRTITGRYMGSHPRKVILFVTTFSFIISLLYIPSTGLVTFFIIRFLHGFMYGSVHNSISTIVVSFIPPKRIGEGLSFFSLSFPVSTAVGPFIGMMLIENFSYRTMFVAASISSGITLILVLMLNIKDNIATQSPIKKEETKSVSSFFSSFIDVKLLPLSLVVALASMCYSGVTTFIDPYLKSIDLPKTAPLFFITYACLILIFRPPVGKLLDRKGENFVLTPAIIFFSLGLTILSFATTQTVVLANAIPLALGFGNILTTGNAIAVKMATSGNVGRATSTYYVCTDIALGVGPLLLGIIATSGGFETMYRVAAGILILVLVLYYIIHGRKVKTYAQAGLNNGVLK